MLAPILWDNLLEDIQIKVCRVPLVYILKLTPGISPKPGLPSKYRWLQPSASTRLQPSACLPSHRHTCKRVQWSSDAAPATRKTRLPGFCVEAHAIGNKCVHFEKVLMFSCCNGSSLVHVQHEEHEMAGGSFHAKSTNFEWNKEVDVF